MNERSRVQRLLSPQSIAIVGIAAPGEGEPAQSHMEIMGMRVLANLDRFSFAGDLHLVSRSSSVNDRPTLPAISDLPEGIDVALLAVEAEESVAALKACAERGVASAILYAGGFAERGEAGAAIQRELAQVAHDNGIALLGPNTVGLSNFVDGVSLSFGNHKPIPLEGRKGVALLTQTGGVSGQSRLALESMDVPVAYSVCTGNQAALSVAGLLSFMIEDQAVSVILIFAEQIRDQEDFLRGIERARDAGKPVVLLHPGASERARKAAERNTGSVVGDHAATIATARDAGAIIVETLEEFWDAGEILLRFGALPSGPAVLVTDGGVKGLLADSCEREGLRLAGFSPATVAALEQEMRGEGEIANPLDLGGQGLTDWHVYGRAVRHLLDAPEVGIVIISIMPGPPDIGLRNARATLPAIAGATKPVIYTLMGDTSPLAPELVPEMHAAGIPFRRSPERAIRSMACLTRANRND